MLPKTIVDSKNISSRTRRKHPYPHESHGFYSLILLVFYHKTFLLYRKQLKTHKNRSENDCIVSLGKGTYQAKKQIINSINVFCYILDPENTPKAHLLMVRFYCRFDKNCIHLGQENINWKISFISMVHGYICENLFLMANWYRSLKSIVGSTIPSLGWWIWPV